MAALLAVNVQAADGQKKLFFAYRSFWPEFKAMRQFKDAGVNTVCICDGKSLDPDRVKRLTGTAFKTPGVHTVQRDGWKVVYASGYGEITPQTLRQAAVEAGVTIICQDAVPVYANERLVAIHVAEGGEKTVTMPDDCRQVWELYTGQMISVVKRRFFYNFKTPDTALFAPVQ